MSETSVSLDRVVNLISSAMDIVIDRVKEEQAILRKAVGIPPGDEALAEQSFNDLESSSPGLFGKDAYKLTVAAPQPTGLSSFTDTFNEAAMAIAGFMSTTDGADQILRQALSHARIALDDLQALSEQLALDFGRLAILGASGHLRPPQPADVESIASQAEEAAAQTAEDANQLARAAHRREAARRILADEQPTPDDGIRVPNRDFVTIEGTNEVITVNEEAAEVQQDLNGRVSEDFVNTMNDLKASVLEQTSHIAICNALTILGESDSRIFRARRAADSLKAAVDAILSFTGAGFVEGIQNAIQEFTANTLRAVAEDALFIVDRIRTFLNLSPLLPDLTVETVRSASDGFPDGISPLVDDFAAQCGIRTETFCAIADLLALSNAAKNRIADEVKTPAFLGRMRFFLDTPGDGDVEQPLPGPDGEVDLILVEPEAAGSTSIVVKQRASLRPTIVVPGASTSSQYKQGGVLTGGPGTIVLGGESEEQETIDYDSSTFDPNTLEYTVALSTPTVEPHRPVIIGTPDGRNTSVLFRTGVSTEPARRVKLTDADEKLIEAQNADIDFTAFGLSPGDQLLLGQDDIPVTIASIAAAGITLEEDYWDHGLEKLVCLLYQPDIPAASSTARVRIPPGPLRDIVTTNGGTIVLDNGGLLNRSRSDGFIEAAGEVFKSKAPIFGPELLEPGFRIYITDGGGQFDARVDSISTDRREATLATPVAGDDAFLADDGDVFGTTLVATGIGNSAPVGSWLRFSHQTAGADAVRVVSRTSADEVELSAAPGNDDPVEVYRTTVAPEAGALRLVFATRGNLREELAYTSIDAAGGDIFDVNLSSPTIADHRRQVIAVEGTARTVPSSTEAYRATPAAGDLRLDPSQWPIGSTELQMTIEDPTLLTVPILSPAVAALASPGKMYIAGDVLDHTGGVDTGGGVYRFTLAAPTTRPYQDTTLVEVDTLSVLDQFAEVFDVESWFDPLDEWLIDLTGDIERGKQILCRILTGRESDMTFIFARLSLRNAEAALVLDAINLLLNSVILGAPTDDGRLKVTLESLDAAGADKAAGAARAGDLTGLLCLNPDTASSRGEAVSAVAAYREETSDFVSNQALAVAQASLHGDDVTMRTASEVRAGFEAGAQEDAELELRAAKDQKDLIKRLT